jgi:hypothetical protein
MSYNYDSAEEYIKDEEDNERKIRADDFGKVVQFKASELDGKKWRIFNPLFSKTGLKVLNEKFLFEYRIINTRKHLDDLCGDDKIVLKLGHFVFNRMGFALEYNKCTKKFQLFLTRGLPVEIVDTKKLQGNHRENECHKDSRISRFWYR